MSDSYQLVPFKENDTIAEYYFKKIDILLPPKDNENLASEDMKKKIFHDHKFQSFPYILSCMNEPVGITWVELTSDYYGNITAYVPEIQHFDSLVKLLKENRYFKNKMIELVNLEQNTAFIDSCFKHELKSNIRQRMYLWLNEYRSTQLDDHPFRFEAYTDHWLTWSSKVSVDAHAISKDYVDYEEMKTPANRMRLENKVFNEGYGDLNQNASRVIFFNNKPVGFCLVVNVKCWGYEAVPWIFDICIDPSFHGQGIGKFLLQEVIKIIDNDGYDIMGLAVTLTNRNAIGLYNKLGFQDLDIFYEFVDV